MMSKKIVSNEYHKLLFQRLIKYEKSYSENTTKIAVKLAWWNFRWAFLKKKTHKSLSENTIRIAIKLNGGVGDILIQSTYAKELVRYLNSENISVDLFCFKDTETANAVFYNAKYVDNVFSAPEYGKKSGNYDLILNIQRFVMIYYINWERIQKYSDKLNHYCEAIQDFYNKNLFIVCNSPYTDALSTQLATLKGKNRFSQPDILSIVGLKNDPINFMDLNPEYFNILSDLNLTNRKYITIQRGINHHDKRKESIRNWPVSHYEKFIEIFKKHYPDTLIIQMGYSEDWCEPFRGVDIDLRGKTNFETLKILLKYALLHIDYEGGYAHIRHFLNSPSAVLFGPTDVNFLGYPENINIKNNACQLPCEWVTMDWTEKCIRGFENPPCMYDITPEMVFSAVQDHLDNLAQFSYTVKTDPHFQETCHFFTSSPNNNIAIINYDHDQDKTTIHSTDQITILGLNPEKKKNIQFSGIYNISAKNESFDVVISEINESEKYLMFVLLDLLRVLKNNGKLLLKYKGLNQENMAMFGIDAQLPTTIHKENQFWIIEKQTKTKNQTLY